MNEIIRLIDKEVCKETKAIMVVGGFSASPYLMDRVRREFSSKVKIIINPPEPGVGICHGAVLTSMEPDSGVLLRIARKTYGIRHGRPFQERDPPDKRFLR